MLDAIGYIVGIWLAGSLLYLGLCRGGWIADQVPRRWRIVWLKAAIGSWYQVGLWIGILITTLFHNSRSQHELLEELGAKEQQAAYQRAR